MDAPAGFKDSAEEMKIPFASGKDSPSTAVISNASPASIDVSSASGSRTPAQAAAKSRAKAPEVAAAQATSQCDDESGSDVESLADYAAARHAMDLELLAATGGTKRAAPVAAMSSGRLVPESTPEVEVEVVATTKRAAAPGGAATARKKASDADVANAPAHVTGRPKPPDATDSAVAKRIARPQQSPGSSHAGIASPATKASAKEGVGRGAPPMKAGGEENNVRQVVITDSAATHCGAPQRKSAQSDTNACAGESSMSAMSAGSESRDGDAAGSAKRPSGSAKASAKGGAKASVSAKSAAKVAQPVSFGNVTTTSRPEPPAAQASSDAGSTTSANFAGNRAPLSVAIARIPEESRSIGEDSVEGCPAVAPPAPVCASSSSDARGKGDKVAEQAALVDEWNEVEARTNEFREKDSVDKGKIKANEDVISTPMTFAEALNWVNKLPLDTEALAKLAEEEVEFTQCGCFSRRRSVSSIPGLSRRCQRDMDRVFLLKSTDFDFNEVMHFRMLRTAYTKLTRNKVCPMIGKHWEVLGFQHTDPRTDLNRSGRLLNVLHLFFFFAHHFDILKSAYLLAQDEEQNFPLACVCINLTHMVVQCLLEGKLSRVCNASDRDVLDTTCKIFAGSLFYFYMRWKTLKRTVRDTEATMKEVRGLLEKRPTKLLQELAKGVEVLKQQASASKFEYTDLDFTGRAPSSAGARQGPGVPKRLRNYTASK